MKNVKKLQAYLQKVRRAGNTYVSKAAVKKVVEKNTLILEYYERYYTVKGESHSGSRPGYAGAGKEHGQEM